MSSVGSGVSVGVEMIFVGTGDDVLVDKDWRVGASTDGNAGGSVGASVAGASVGGTSVAAGGCVGAGAAPPQDVMINAKIRTSMIRRIISTHFRIHAGQQVDPAMRDRISPVVKSAICTSILSFMTTLKAKVFPSGDQSGVSTRPFSSFVSCVNIPLSTSIIYTLLINASLD